MHLAKDQLQPNPTAKFKIVREAYHNQSARALRKDVSVCTKGKESIILS